MGVRVEGSLAWVGGYLGQILAGVGAAALVVTASVVIAGRAPRCRLPVLTLALLPFLYSLIPLADHVGQGRYALFAVPMAALLIGIGLDRTGVLVQRWGVARGRQAGASPWVRGGDLRTSLVRIAGLAFVCLLGTIGLRDEPGRALVAFPAPDVTMPVDDSALQVLLASHGVKDAYATYWMAYRVMFETGGRTEVAPYNYDRYPPITATVAASPDPAYLFVSASETLSSFEEWCHGHNVGYRVWHLRGFTAVQPATKINPSMLPRPVLYRNPHRPP
jgi:hypothetical protein